MTKNKPASKHPKTDRQRGKRRNFHAGFWMTEAAEAALIEMNIPKGKEAAFINSAIVLAANPTKERKEK